MYFDVLLSSTWTKPEHLRYCAYVCLRTQWYACMSLSHCVCQWVVLYLGAVTASVSCLRDIRDHVWSATSKRAETWYRPRGLGVDNVRQLRAGETQWHMLSDRKMFGCCRAERRDGPVADWSDSCQDQLCVCVCVCCTAVTRTSMTFRPHSWGQNCEVTLFWLVFITFLSGWFKVRIQI